MPAPDENRIHAFKDSTAFHEWLEKNHAIESELWLKIFKKESKQQTISWEEAVIEALCWGWIDGIKKSLDKDAYLQRFTPRRENSVWSKINREHAKRLIKEGRMQEAGMVHVRKAEANGNWESAYAPASEMKVPDDFLAALENKPQAKAFFSTLNKQNIYAIAYRLHTAKKPETRGKRFSTLMSMLESQKKIH